MKYLLTTESPQSTQYRIFLHTAIKNLSDATGEDVELLYWESHGIKKSSLYMKIFSLISAFIGLFNQDIVAGKLKFKDVIIGRYAIASTLRDPKTYFNKFRYFKKLMYNTLECCLFRQQIQNIIDKEDLISVYLDHGCFNYGVIIDVISDNGIPLFLNHYPRGYVKYNFDKRASFEDVVNLPFVQDNPANIEQGLNYVRDIIEDPRKIPYMGAKLIKKEENFEDITHVLYTHSFTDEQLHYGYDGVFISVLEWMEFTLKHLKNGKLLIKAHPNFYAEGFQSDIVYWDNLIFKSVISKYRDHPRIRIVDYPLANGDFLKMLNPETIMLSHHGTALLEASFYNFKCISSKASVWREYDFINTWRSKSHYKELLNSSYSDLKTIDRDQFGSFCYQLFCKNGSYFSNKCWLDVMANLLNIEPIEIVKTPTIIDGLTVEQENQLVSVLSQEMVVFDIN